MELKENVLSFDTAKMCGWCVYVKGEPKEYGETDLGETGGIQFETLWNLVNEKAQKFDISVIVAENIFLGENKATFAKLNKYQAIIQLYAQLNGIEFITKGFAPSEWKRTLLGYNKAFTKKTEVLTYIRTHIDRKVKSDNVADAIAINLTWHKRKLFKRH